MNTALASAFTCAAVALVAFLGRITQPTPPSEYLYLWASSADSTAPDFLAVYDVRANTGNDRYGTLVSTLPVPGRGHRTHHTEHELAADRQLFKASGRLSIDTRFRAPGSSEPGLRMEGVVWPHGGSGAAVPHGAVFSRPPASTPR